jgi:hypothetical protein
MSLFINPCSLLINFTIRRVKMTKKFLWEIMAVLIAAGTMAALAGCNSIMPVHYGQVEQPEPGEELCTLIIDSALELNYWGHDRYSNVSILQIPAGVHGLTFDYIGISTATTPSRIITTTSTAENIPVTYEFLPGRRYKAEPVFSRTGNQERVGVEITETSIPVRAGVRFGIFPGWLVGNSGQQELGVHVSVQAGLVTTGNIPVEFMAEGNIGAGYNFFADFTIQGGGTVNAYFGKSKEKTGLGIGGGVGLSYPDGYSADPVYIPYVRASFYPYSDDWFMRLFVDYSFSQEDLWKRFGLGMQIFVKK